jgi:hypothetical protein
MHALRVMRRRMHACVSYEEEDACIACHAVGIAGRSQASIYVRLC